MNTLSRIFLSLFFMLLGSVATAGEVPFNQQTFDELRATGKPVVVHVHAQWCGTCKRQAKIVSPMLAQPQFKDLTLMRADYDKEKVLLKSLNIRAQSVFVVFKGEAEVGRSIGDTNEDSIAALFRKAL